MRYLLFILLCCFTQNIVSQANIEKLQSIVDKQLSYSEFDHANVTLTLLDIETNNIIASHRPDKVLIPASSLKLITTLTGIKTLGPEFRFKTGLYYNGSIDDQGVLNGDIVIVGGGDPTLGSSSYDGYPNFNALLASMVNAIKNHNITCVNGLIVVDESVYDSYPIAPTWQWNDLGNYYASGAWGLNVNENQYFIHFSNRDIIGRQPKISSIYPDVPLLKLSNEITVDSAGTGDQAYIFGGPYNYDKRIVGTIPQGNNRFTIKGSIPDPPTFLAYHVRRSLELDNIQSTGSKSMYLPYKKQKQLLKEYQSTTLKNIVKRANEKSDNLYTEAILKMIGLKKRGQGSGQNGINIVKKQIKKIWCKA